MSTLRYLFLLGLGLAFVPFACAQSNETDDGDTDPSATTSASGGSAGAGGAVGGAGAGGTGACAIDCSTVSTTQCTEAVCNDGSHPGTVGQCVIIDLADATPCDDDQFCTTVDQCEAGVCVGTTPNDCGLTPDACEEVICDEAADDCSMQALSDGTSCQGADLCITGSTCSAGNCVGGALEECFFFPVPDECHVAQCNPLDGMCEAVVGNEGGTCVDQTDLCTVGKTCTAGLCMGGMPKDCSQLTSGCNLGVCDTPTGTCITQTVMNGQPCDDLDACTTGETCNASVCNMGSPVTACSQTADGCCPSSCTAANDYDCNCPGTFVNGICVYLADPNSFSLSAAQAVCLGLGSGWDLCSPTLLCDTATLTYLGNAGFDCTGGVGACNCASPNTYFHVNATNSPYYVRAPEIPNCGAAACTNSVSQNCGAALCCKP